MVQEIFCEVDNCTYWGYGNKCEAEAIYVVKNVDVPETTEETDCKTFEPMS